MKIVLGGKDMKIFVGCSSSNKIDGLYLKSARELGEMIAKNGHTLIFGSSNKGMMKEVYEGIKENGGKIISVFPKHYNGILTKVESNVIIETETATEQLKYLVNEGDLTIIMPGGFGTFAELITSIQNKKLKEHNKPILIININGYFDLLLQTFERIYQEKFDSEDKKELYTVCNGLDEVSNYLHNIKK